MFSGQHSMSHNDNCWVLKMPLRQCCGGLNHVTKQTLPGVRWCSAESGKLPPAPETGGKAHPCNTAVPSTHAKGCVSFQLLLAPYMTQGSHILFTSPMAQELHSQCPACTPLPALANVPPVAGDRPQCRLSALQRSTERELEVARHTKVWPFPLIWLPSFPGTC